MLLCQKNFDWTIDVDDDPPGSFGRINFGGKGGKSNTTTVQKSDPWSGQQPYLSDTFAQAQRLYNSAGPDFYPGSTVAPMSPMSDAAIKSIYERGMSGSPLTFAGGQNLADTLSGNYLNANPSLDATFNRAADQFKPRIDSMFSGAGRYGSGAHQGVMQEGLGNLATDIYGQNYANERRNQLGAATLAPQYANQDYTDLQAAMGAGGAIDAKAQQYLQGNLDRFNFYQARPQQKLNDYAQAVAGNSWGGQSTSTAPNSSNPLLGAAGGALGAYGLSQIPALAGLGGPWGLAAGALLGGLLG